MYFPDGATYDYAQVRDPAVLCVGWLAKGRPFQTGAVPRGWLEHLKSNVPRLYSRQMRGSHDCEFCGRSGNPDDPEEEALEVAVGDEVYDLGSAELRVPAGAVTFAAPTLVIHYIEAHSYLPPPEFIAAVWALPTPT